MQIASSANRTCKELRSASQYTAAVLMPSSRQADKIRSAIPPRLAIRIFRNIGLETRLSGSRLLFAILANAKKRLAILNRLSVLDKYANHFPGHVRFDFVHQLHGFNNA